MRQLIIEQWMTPDRYVTDKSGQRIPVGVFETCFSHIVGLCIHKGLVSGHTQVINLAYIKANASMSRLKPKPA